MISYREAVPADAAALAELHTRYIHWGFLTSLGKNVLRKVYESLIAYPGAAIIVAADGDRVSGYVAGVRSVKGYYGFFIRRYSFAVLPHLLTKAGSVLRMLETLLYAGRSAREDLPGEELLAIVVEKEYQGGGVARGLFEGLRKWFREQGGRGFKTTVGENNHRSVEFFRKLGLREAGLEEIHRNDRSRIFVCEE